MVNRRTIFLLDGLGALVSAFFLGVVLPAFSHWIGLPVPLLHALGGIAVGLSCYSLGCYALADPAKPGYLRRLIGFNLAYCVVTLVMTVVYFQSFTKLGLLYFYGEIVIILALVKLELQVLRSANPT